MAYRTANFEEWVDSILALPVGTYFDSYDDRLQVHGYTREESRKIRAVFPGQIWSKEKNEGCGWWEYKTTLPSGQTIRIIADREGPASCKRIVETVEEVVHVPACEAHDETRKVEKVRWECSEEESVEGGATK